jgi:hypothetical protein
MSSIQHKTRVKTYLEKLEMSLDGSGNVAERGRNLGGDEEL